VGQHDQRRLHAIAARGGHLDMPRKGIHKPRSRSRTHLRAVWLTRRELEVLGLMATGMKNREISAALSGLARHAHLGGELCRDHSRFARKTRIRVLNRGIGAPDRQVQKFEANLGPKLGPFRPQSGILGRQRQRTQQDFW
jgi:hypothetical protein